MDICNLMLETESNLKLSLVKPTVLEIMATCVHSYGQTQNVQTTIMQNLRYSTHLAEPMADLVSHCITMDSTQIIEDLLGEIGQIEFAADGKAGKEVSKFLVRLATQNQRYIMKYLSLFSHQMDSDSYTIRCAMIEVFGMLIGKYLTVEMTENTINQAVNLCM